MSTRSTQVARTSGARRQSGFSLIEVIVVIAIMAVIAGIAIPMVDMGLERERGNATLNEMDGLKDALLAYFEDHLAFPAALADLTAGGYIAARFQDSDVWTDAWGGDYVYSVSGTDATLTSYAADRTATAPNYVLTLSGVTFLRSHTVADMETIHRGLAGYEARRVPESLAALPTTWWDVNAPATSAMGMLIASGQLENSIRFATDAWGDGYAFAGSPADRVTSTHLP